VLPPGRPARGAATYTAEEISTLLAAPEPALYHAGLVRAHEEQQAARRAQQQRAPTQQQQQQQQHARSSSHQLNPQLFYQHPQHPQQQQQQQSAAAPAGGGLQPVASSGGAAAGGFARLTYTRALALLNASGDGALPQLAWGADLSSEHERWLAERHVQGPVFVTHYPASLKPFYMRRSRGREGSGGGGATVENFDLLVPGLGELAGGSAREEDLGVLGGAMAAQGLLSPAFAAAVAERARSGGGGGLGVGVADPANGHLDWYLDLRRYGCVPSAGWGLGFERLVAWAAGLDNVRDAAPFPRARNLCSM
jgi:aspartyl/asparaginyl-tRNA synthetase